MIYLKYYLVQILFIIGCICHPGTAKTFDLNSNWEYTFSSGQYFVSGEPRVLNRYIEVESYTLNPDTQITYIYNDAYIIDSNQTYNDTTYYVSCRYGTNPLCEYTSIGLPEIDDLEPTELKPPYFPYPLYINRTGFKDEEYVFLNTTYSVLVLEYGDGVSGGKTILSDEIGLIEISSQNFNGTTGSFTSTKLQSIDSPRTITSVKHTHNKSIPQSSNFILQKYLLNGQLKKKSSSWIR